LWNKSLLTKKYTFNTAIYILAQLIGGFGASASSVADINSYCTLSSSGTQAGSLSDFYVCAVGTEVFSPWGNPWELFHHGTGTSQAAPVVSQVQP
jgi:hypothetical protein